MRSGSATALFDVHLNDDIHVLKACGLGGTSLINANVCLSPDVRIFEDTAWPLEVRRDRLLAEGYVRARHMLRPEPSARTSSYEKVKALRLAASAFGRGVQPIPLHVVYKSGLNAAGVHQEACTECGDCCGGCNIGAKTTVASTYLADAAAFGAEIFTEMRVLSLTKGDDGIWQVWVPVGVRRAARPRSRPPSSCSAPAPSAPPRFFCAARRRGSRCRSGSAAASPPMATLSPWPTTTTCR